MCLNYKNKNNYLPSLSFLQYFFAATKSGFINNYIFLLNNFTSSCFSFCEICLFNKLIFFKRIDFLSFSFLSWDFSSLSCFWDPTEIISPLSPDFLNCGEIIMKKINPKKMFNIQSALRVGEDSLEIIGFFAFLGRE